VTIFVKVGKSIFESFDQSLLCVYSQVDKDFDTLRFTLYPPAEDESKAELFSKVSPGSWKDYSSRLPMNRMAANPERTYTRPLQAQWTFQSIQENRLV
jgi:hypothetical protein